eukprot:jgi/Tetstr1/447324/TSEL_034761.t1
MDDYRRVTRTVLANNGSHHPTEVEISAFNKAIDSCSRRGVPCSWDNPRFAEAYKSAALYVIRNCDMMNRLVTEREMDPRKISNASPCEVNPEKWADLVEIRRRCNEQRGCKPQAMTDEFVCKKCRGRNCNVFEAQIKSADEPTSLFISCLDCGNRWVI